MSESGGFTGFTHEALQFLVDLALNNERSWFQPRKADYERLLKEPLEALCDALDERFAAHHVPLHADARSSPFRIYRDVRFSKDKSPYKTHVAASFPWRDAAEEAPRHAGGGYFSMAPMESYIGGGMWHPEPARLTAWRQAVVRDPAAIRAILDEPRFVATFTDVHGDALRRVPAGYDPAHPEVELLKLKDVTFGRRLDEDDLFSPELPDRIASHFEAAVPLFRLFARLDA
jgi:uncharacterized protein (TIGR02453 family)